MSSTESHPNGGSSLHKASSTSSEVTAGSVAVESDLLVWIDQDLCTGDGICTDHAPEVFMILEDGIAYCVEDGRVLNDPGGSVELARVPRASEAAVIASANECPGECIFIDLSEVKDEADPA